MRMPQTGSLCILRVIARLVPKFECDPTEKRVTDPVTLARAGYTNDDGD